MLRWVTLRSANLTLLSNDQVQSYQSPDSRLNERMREQRQVSWSLGKVLDLFLLLSLAWIWRGRAVSAKNDSPQEPEARAEAETRCPLDLDLSPLPPLNPNESHD
jgi:hypothetical protein